MKKLIVVSMLGLVFAGSALASSTTTTPTCSLTVPSSLPAFGYRTANIQWTSTGGTSAKLTYSTWSIPTTVVSTTLNGNQSVSLPAAMGLNVVLTVNGVKSSATCQANVPIVTPSIK